MKKLVLIPIMVKAEDATYQLGNSDRHGYSYSSIDAVFAARVNLWIGVEMDVVLHELMDVSYTYVLVLRILVPASPMNWAGAQVWWVGRYLYLGEILAHCRSSGSRGGCLPFSSRGSGSPLS